MRIYTGGTGFSFEELLTLLGPLDFSSQTMKALFRLGTVRSLTKGEFLLSQGEQARFCFLVIRGRASRILYTREGASRKIGEAGPGEWGGLAETLLVCPAPASWEVSKNSHFLLFSGLNLQKLRENRDLDCYFMRFLAREGLLLVHRIEENTPKVRIRTLLLAGNERLNLTQEKLAYEAGTTRETVNRYLKSLERNGLIALNRGEICLLNREALSLLDD